MAGIDSDGDESLDEYVQENRELLTQTLRQTNDPYTRACVLALLKRGNTERHVEEVKQDLDRLT